MSDPTPPEPESVITLIIAAVFIAVAGTAAGLWWLTGNLAPLILGGLWVVGFIDLCIEGVTL